MTQVFLIMWLLTGRGLPNILLGPCSMRVVTFLPSFGPLHPRKVLPTLPDEASSHCMPCAGCRACGAWRVA